MNQKLIDRIVEVSEWPAEELGGTGRGMIALARELRDMIEAEPAPEPTRGPAYDQRDILIISAATVLIESGRSAGEAFEEARALLDEFDASREVKP